MPTPEQILGDLDRRLAEQPPPPDADTSYCLDMWRYLLDRQLRHLPPAAPGVDALPYVPFDPADHGLRLTAADTVLDIGCQSGYGLADFALSLRRAGRPVPRLIGVDVRPVHLRFARAMAPLWAPDTATLFLRADAAALPFGDGRAALILLRLVLPYVDIRRTLAEAARLLRPGGLLLVQLHTPAYYRQQAFRHLHQPKRCLHSARAILAGWLFALRRRQCRWRYLRETALTPAQLIAAAAPHGFSFRWQSPADPKALVLLAATAP